MLLLLQELTAMRIACCSFWHCDVEL